MQPLDVNQIDVKELQGALNSGAPFQLLDVRDAYEWDIAKLKETTHFIPLPLIAQKADELDPEVKTFVICRSGIRSLMAIGQLQSQGFDKLINVRGGILAWSDQIDPEVKKY